MCCGRLGNLARCGNATWPVFVVSLAFLGGAFHTYHSYFGIWANGPKIAQHFNARQFMPPDVVCRMVRTEHDISQSCRRALAVFVYGFDLPKNVRAAVTVRWHWQILSDSERKFAFTNQLFGEDDRRYGQFDERCPMTGRLALLGYLPSRSRSILKRRPELIGDAAIYDRSGDGCQICPSLTHKSVRLAINCTGAYQGSRPAAGVSIGWAKPARTR